MAYTAQCKKDKCLFFLHKSIYYNNHKKVYIMNNYKRSPWKAFLSTNIKFPWRKKYQLEIFTISYNVQKFWKGSLLYQGNRKNISSTFYVINNMAYNWIINHVVDHIKSSRNIFPFTLMKEGIPPKILNIIWASNYFKLYLLLSPWIKSQKLKFLIENILLPRAITKKYTTTAL